jgi:AraC-like DNA-binding protein
MHPLLEAAMGRLVWPVSRRQVLPARSRAQNPQHSFQHFAPIAPRTTAPALPHEEKAAYIDPWLRVQQRLDSTLHGNLNIGELARQMGLSTDHFIRRFKNRFGVSPKVYHMRARLQEAARSLRDGQSIKSVAYRLGFSDARSFAHRFKHCLGITPADLRTSNSSAPTGTICPHKQGFPINVHLLPLQPEQSGFDRYLPKSRHATTTFERPEVIQDKIRHPERYV